MKINLLILALIFLASENLFAQQDTLQVSTRTTVHIRFASEIKYVDLPDRIIGAKIVEGGRNIVALKAKEPFDYATSVSALESNGRIHTFILTYSESPDKLIHSVVAEDPKPEWIARLSSSSKNRLYHIGAKAYGISIFCTHILAKDDMLYLVFEIDNHSPISYTLAEPRFAIESRKKSKRKLVYEKQIFPKYTFCSTSDGRNVPSGAKIQIIYAFDKVSVLNDQVLNAAFYEAGGNRNYKLILSCNDINRPENTLFTL